MPNGGSDCCGTCWFNARNNGELGFADRQDAEVDYCTIRKLAIEDPFYTYCCNHPHRRPDRDLLPIGPVFVDPQGSGRRIWEQSPDSEEIRLHLVDLLSNINQEAAEEYPIGIYTDELVVWQLGEFRESRAEEDLRRIVTFAPWPAYGKARRTRSTLVTAAREALNKLEPPHGSEPSAAVPQPKWWELWKRISFRRS
jgi:hypothetical protein